MSTKEQLELQDKSKRSQPKCSSTEVSDKSEPTKHGDSNSDASSSKSKGRKTSSKSYSENTGTTSQSKGDNHQSNSKSLTKSDKSSSKSTDKKSDKDDKLPTAETRKRDRSPDSVPQSSKRQRLESQSEGEVSDYENEAQILRNIKDQLSRIESSKHHFTFDENEVMVQDDEIDNFGVHPFSNVTQRKTHDMSYSILSDASLLNNIVSNEAITETEEGDDFMKILTEGTDCTKKGKSLKSDTMPLVENFFNKEPNAEIIKTIKDRYPEPENCDVLSGKDVNLEIYRGLNQFVKKRDHALKSIQAAVSTASIANLRLIEETLQLVKTNKLSRQSANTIVKLASDSTKVLAKGHSDISLFRKFLMRQQMEPKYQQLCMRKTYDKLLFGKDLPKDIKDIDEESKIIKSIVRTNRYPRNNFQSYATATQSRPAGRGFLARPYRGGRRGQNRGRGRGQFPSSQTQSKH